MPELGPYGSVRGARGNSRPYRESDGPTVKVTRLDPERTFVPAGERSTTSSRRCGQITCAQRVG